MGGSRAPWADQLVQKAAAGWWQFDAFEIGLDRRFVEPRRKGGQVARTRFHGADEQDVRGVGVPDADVGEDLAERGDDGFESGVA